MCSWIVHHSQGLAATSRCQRGSQAEEMKIEAKRVHVLKAHVKTDMILLSVSLRSLECNHLASLASGKAEVICNMQLTCKVDLQGQFFLRS